MVEYKKKIINLKGGGIRNLYYKEYKNGKVIRVKKEEANKKGGGLLSSFYPNAMCSILKNQEKQTCPITERVTVRFFEKDKHDQPNGLTAKNAKCCIDLASIPKENLNNDYIGKTLYLKNKLNLSQLEKTKNPILYDGTTLKLNNEKYIAKIVAPLGNISKLKKIQNYNNSGNVQEQQV
jgi:hypothetical protein